MEVVDDFLDMDDFTHLKTRQWRDFIFLGFGIQEPPLMIIHLN